jgi:hypothetical protein
MILAIRTEIEPVLAIVLDVLAAPKPGPAYFVYKGKAL